MIDLVKKPEPDGPAEPHPVRADQLEVIPPRALVDDAIADVERAIEDEPQLREAAREPARDPLRPGQIHLAKIHDQPVIAGLRKIHGEAGGFIPRSSKALGDHLPRIPRPPLLRVAMRDLVLRVRLGLDQRKLRRELPFRRNTGTNQPRHAAL
jgi:hypothetical protein